MSNDAISGRNLTCEIFDWIFLSLSIFIIIIFTLLLLLLPLLLFHLFTISRAYKLKCNDSECIIRIRSTVGVINHLITI